MLAPRSKYWWFGTLLALAAASVLLVGVKYWLWAGTRYADPITHLGVQMHPLGALYAATLDFFYAPARMAVGMLASILPVGGVAIDVVADLVAIVLQNALLLFACLALLRARGTRPGKPGRASYMKR